MSTTEPTKQPAIETQMVNIGERMEGLSKSLSNLEDRLTPVRNINRGVDKAETPESLEKATSPINDRLKNFTGMIDSFIYRVNAVLSELEI